MWLHKTNLKLRNKSHLFQTISKLHVAHGYLLAKLSNRTAALYEVLEELFLSLQVSGSHQPQIHDDIIWHALLIKRAQQFSYRRLLITWLDQVHELVEQINTFRRENVHSKLHLKTILTVLWKSSMVNSVNPWLTRSSLLLAAIALNLPSYVTTNNFRGMYQG